jgi:hypothetical protein
MFSKFSVGRFRWRKRLPLIVGVILGISLELFTIHVVSQPFLSLLQNRVARTGSPQYTVLGDARQAVITYRNCASREEIKIITLPWTETCDLQPGSRLSIVAQRMERNEGEIYAVITGKGIHKQAGAKGPLATTEQIFARVP